MLPWEKSLPRQGASNFTYTYDAQWWITIFNPQYQDDIRPEHLHLKCIIKFDALRFAAIYSEARNCPDKDKYKKYWTFNNITKTAVLRF